MSSNPIAAATGPARRKTGRRSRATRPASTAKEALNRWGFGGAWRGGQLIAYSTDKTKRPRGQRDRHAPEDCSGGPVSWSQIYVVPPAAPTVNDPYPRPRRRRTTAKQICWDCQQWLEDENRRAFRREFGGYSLEDAEIAVRVTRLDGAERREEIQQLTDEATDRLYWRNRIELEALLGVDLAMPIDQRYEQAKLLVEVRRTPLDQRAALVEQVRAVAA